MSSLYHKHSEVMGIVCEKKKLLTGLAVSPKVIQYPYITKKAKGDFSIIYLGFNVACNIVLVYDSFMGRGNQYIQLVKVLNCKLSTICKKLPSFPHKVQGLNRQPQRWEVSVLPLYLLGPRKLLGESLSVLCV